MRVTPMPRCGGRGNGRGGGDCSIPAPSRSKRHKGPARRVYPIAAGRPPLPWRTQHTYVWSEHLSSQLSLSRACRSYRFGCCDCVYGSATASICDSDTSCGIPGSSTRFRTVHLNCTGVTGGAVNDAAWWARVVKARTERADLMPQRVWALRKDGHQAAIDVRRYPASVRKTCSRLTASPLWTRVPWTPAG